MHILTAEEKKDIWGGFKNGMTYFDLLTLYPGVTANQLVDCLYEKETEEPFKNRKVKDIMGKKIDTLPASVKKEIWERLNRNSPDIEDIANKYGVRFTDLEELYTSDIWKKKEFYKYRDKVKKLYFSGKTVKEIQEIYGFFDATAAAILDREAIIEDFKAGMTVAELLETWGNKDLNDLTFNGEMETGTRYSRKQILAIIFDYIEKT